MIRRPPRSTQSRSSAASDVYKRQLFVVRRLCPAWLPKIGRPEARRVRSQDLVGKNNDAPAIVLTAEAELELGVGEKHTSLPRDRLGPLVDRDRQSPEGSRCLRSDDAYHRVVGHVLVVVADRRLRRGREDRLVQAAAVLEAVGQGHTTHLAGPPVIQESG